MADISAQAVQQLREKTGLGLMQCKQALAVTGGDHEKAIEHLRKQGAAVAAKRAGRETKEGKVVFATEGPATAVVEINCETDFVASSGDFNTFANKAAKTIAAKSPAGLDDLKDLPAEGSTLGEIQTAAIAKMGENISLRRFAVEKAGAGEHVETYSHMDGKIGVLVKVGFSGSPKDSAALSTLAKDWPCRWPLRPPSPSNPRTSRPPWSRRNGKSPGN
jgi:elongation factor Ts